MNPVRRTIFGYVFAAIALALVMTSAGQEPAAMQPEPDATSTLHHIKTVFLIVMENHNWTGAPSGNIKGNPSAPYINYTLLPMASYANDYRKRGRVLGSRMMVRRLSTT